MLILVAQMPFSLTFGQLIDNAPPPLSFTNAVELGSGIATELLASSDQASSCLERHLLFDAHSGEFKGVFRDSKDGRVYLFDAEGLVSLMVRKKKTSDISVFDKNGNWIYIVKNGKHVFNRSGQREGTLLVSNGKLIFIQAKSDSSLNQGKASELR